LKDKRRIKKKGEGQTIEYFIYKRGREVDLFATFSLSLSHTDFFDWVEKQRNKEGKKERGILIIDCSLF
jgi:hypothetical protein